jgi:hypothetical protein
VVQIVGEECTSCIAVTGGRALLEGFLGGIGELDLPRDTVVRLLTHVLVGWRPSSCT